MRRLNYVCNFFNSLMTTPCEVVSPTETTRADGTRAITYSTSYSGYCSYHSITINESKFADKIGTKTVYVVCLPKDTVITDTCRIKINDVLYTVIGVRSATNTFEVVCEVVKYE